LFVHGSCHVKPLIILEKPKENNYVCQEKSLYRSMPFELFRTAIHRIASESLLLLK